MTQASPLIVRAQCVANSTAWDAAEIWTFTAFQVRQVLAHRRGEPSHTRANHRAAAGRNRRKSHSTSPEFRASAPERTLCCFSNPQRAAISPF